MAKLSLQLKLGQHLTMTPQLQQAIRLLQMPVLELNTQLQEALEANVMLEQEEPPETPVTNEQPEVVAGEEREQIEWADLYGSGHGKENWSGADEPQFELPDTSGETLQDHLLWQLEMGQFKPRETVIGQTIIDYINDDGYLTESLENIVAILPAEAEFSIAEAEARPTGYRHSIRPVVGGRTVAECIAIQLQQLSPLQPGRDLALQIAAHHLDAVAEMDPASLRRNAARVRSGTGDDAVALIRACHPRPGSAIQSSAAEYIVPDVHVRKQDGRWVVEINRASAPRLRVNQAYADMLKGDGQHALLRTQLQEARWLVRSLEIRHDTLLRVAMSIVERQVRFSSTAKKP